MRPLSTITARSISISAIGCTVFILACGESGSSNTPGSGGAGTGGTVGSGGSTVPPDAAMVAGTGGKLTATGGTSSQPGTGGASPQGSGGRPGQGTGGGSTVVGGRTGRGGATVVGGRAGTGGMTGGSGGGTTQPAGTGGSGGGSTGTSTPAVPSAGCGKAGLTSGTQNITVGSAQREYILKVPDGYDKDHPYRLIFGFHGGKYNASWVATGEPPASGGTPLSGPWFGIESESKGSAIFVAPQASGVWAETDLAFVDAMVEKLEAELCIDKSRVFATGFSMGAIMTIGIGCNRSEVFRGIAPMSGTISFDCPPGQHIAYWAAHGTKDTTIRPAEGEAARDEFIKRNHCTTTASSPNANNCVTYSGCDPGYPVSWCTWSGAHDPAPFAGPEIWSFISPL